MRIVICLAALAATACATAPDIYAAGVDETAIIAKPLAEVSQCLSLQMGAGPITTADGQSSFAVKDAYGSTLGLIGLSAVPEGTKVEVRRRDSLVSTGMWKHCR